jgi:cobyrinic acid a,c-diamide synthase
MSRLPRLAVGTLQPHTGALAVLWALSDVLSRRDLHIQHFLSRGCFVPHHGALPGGNGGVRYLDSWLMSPEICRELFAYGARAGDLALVQGRYCGDWPAAESVGGNLDLLCRWLDLPKLVVLDALSLDEYSLPDAPACEGILLDRVRGPRELARWQTLLESLWNVPVLGALGEVSSLREQIERLPAGVEPPRALCRSLGDDLAPSLRVDRLLSIAAGRSFPPLTTNRLRAGAYLNEVTVAVAYDDAFNCYFPDTLDLLELQGATVKVFSPLADADLPADTEVVYLGCGHPERCAEALAENRCLLSALWKHVLEGGRVYAEGGGLAYLCQELAMPDGRRWPMAGVLPAIAHLVASPPPPSPVEITLAQTNWLGEGWSQLRGYVNGRWRLEPTEAVICYAAEEGHELDLIGAHQVIGSRIHLNFAAQPEFLQAFFAPHRPADDCATISESQVSEVR